MHIDNDAKLVVTYVAHFRRYFNFLEANGKKRIQTWERQYRDIITAINLNGTTSPTVVYDCEGGFLKNRLTKMDYVNF